MSGLEVDMEKSKKLVTSFSNSAEILEANPETMLYTAITLLMAILGIVVKPDPITGKKFGRIMSMIPGLIESWNLDNDIDKTLKD